MARIVAVPGRIVSCARPLFSTVYPSSSAAISDEGAYRPAAAARRQGVGNAALPLRAVLLGGSPVVLLLHLCRARDVHRLFVTRHTRAAGALRCDARPGMWGEGHARPCPELRLEKVRMDPSKKDRL